MEVKKKKCPKCGKDKKLNKFYKEARAKLGVSSHCKKCKNETNTIQHPLKYLMKYHARHWEYLDRDEFIERFLDDKMQIIWDLYERSGYDRDYAPVIYRIDPKKPHRIDNLRLRVRKEPTKPRLVIDDPVSFVDYLIKNSKK